MSTYVNHVFFGGIARARFALQNRKKLTGREKFWKMARLSEQAKEKTKNIQLKVFSKIANIAGYTHAGRTSLIITPTSSSRQCSCCNFSSVPSSVEAGRSASTSRCLAGLHFTPKFFPNVMRYNSHATLILSFASSRSNSWQKSADMLLSVQIWIVWAGLCQELL